MLRGDDDGQAGRRGGILHKDAGVSGSVEAAVAVGVEVAVVVTSICRRVTGALVRAAGQREQEEKQKDCQWWLSHAALVGVRSQSNISFRLRSILRLRRVQT
jgi:aspartokinase